MPVTTAATAASPEHFGDFGEGGFDLLVQDMVELTLIAKEENPGKPFILFGHSMGSFAAQQYVLDHSYSIDGLVLSGSGALDGLARLGSSARSQEDIFVNARFEPARTPFDCLSRDTCVVDAFMNDPLCFAALQPPSTKSFLAASVRLADRMPFRKYAQTFRSICFPALRIPSDSNWKEFAPLSSATRRPACAISRTIFARVDGTKCLMN